MSKNDKKLINEVPEIEQNNDPVDTEEWKDVEEVAEAPKKPVVKPTPKSSLAASREFYKNAMQEINMTLADSPGVLDIVKVKKTVTLGDSEALKDVYSWAIQSKEASKVRREIKALLNDAWQSSALNYQMISKSLRIPEISVQAMLDVNFIEANGL